MHARVVSLPLRALLAAVMLCAFGAATAQASPPAGTWHQIFADEFSGTSLDSGKWSTCYTFGCSNANNGELEWYQAGNDTVSSGLLHLTAKKEAINAYNYTSGMVATSGANATTPPKFAFKYGYLEMSAQVPRGNGFWPAFWMLPASYKWPPEIDVMEILGNDPTTATMTLHYNSGRNGLSHTTFTGPDFSAGQHVYGLDWEPNAIVWYIDGVERYRYTTKNRIPNAPMYVIANLAVGGWPGPPDSTTPFPSEMAVDYIRVYQH
jgi:beta-glucanase (GH16 family)